MTSGEHIESALVDMRRRQIEAADHERHLRVARTYVDQKLRKALSGIDVDSIDVDVTSASCSIQVWIPSRDTINQALQAIDKDEGKWRLGPGRFSFRNTFQYCKGPLKGMITVCVYWVLAKPEDPKAAAMPQNQET